MGISSRSDHYWGAILAGGDGERLRPLTKFIAGDDRPKQFCPLLEGGRTLLEGTRARVAETVPLARTLFVLTRQHKPFYSAALTDVPTSRLLVQPSNRGTLPAILCGLAQVLRIDSDAVVAFFPSDHYYSREQVFVQGVLSGFAAARLAADSVILLGAKALSPEPGYGYIEPGHVIPGADGRVRRVERFWEKPTAESAQALLDHDCLWNTFVMIGRARAFLGLIEVTVPELYRAFEPLFASPIHPGSQASFQAGLEDIYRQISDADFSKLVLSRALSRLAVLDLGDIGWSDLGDPLRVIATLSAHGIPSPWRQLWLREMGIAPVAG